MSKQAGGLPGPWWWSAEREVSGGLCQRRTSDDAEGHHRSARKGSRTASRRWRRRRSAPTEGASRGDLAAFDAAWQEVNAGAEQTERLLKRRLLRGLDLDTAQVLIEGQPYVRVGRYPATYKTRQGPVEIERSLYRRVGERNGPTVDTVSGQAGCVADGWLPEAAVPMAYLLARGTSREAEATARQVGVLPYCRASFERVGHEVGALYGGQRPQVEAALARKLRVPRGTRGVSVSMDRVAVPMEEPKRRPVGRPRKGAPTRPVDVVWRMAYAACLTFHDAHGEALGTIRYGRMPRGEARGLAERLARDVQALVSRRRGLYVAVLTDGAPELHALLDETLATHVPSAKKPVRLVDFWHLMEKLGSAARVVAGGEKSSSLREKWKLSLLNTPGAAWTIVTLRMTRPGARWKEASGSTPWPCAHWCYRSGGTRRWTSRLRRAGPTCGAQHEQYGSHTRRGRLTLPDASGTLDGAGTLQLGTRQCRRRRTRGISGTRNSTTSTSP